MLWQGGTCFFSLFKRTRRLSKSKKGKSLCGIFLLDKILSSLTDRTYRGDSSFFLFIVKFFSFFQVTIRPMMYIALTYDHRLIDGREAVTFLRSIKRAVEDPRVMFLDL